MTMPGVSCTAVAVQNSSEWPCSLCPFPQLRLVGVRTSYIYFSNISWIPRVLDPVTNPYLGPPLGCTLLQSYWQKALISWLYRMNEKNLSYYFYWKHILKLYLLWKNYVHYLITHFLLIHFHLNVSQQLKLVLRFWKLLQCSKNSELLEPLR